MVAAAPKLDRTFWLSLVMGAALLCGLWAGPHVAANDDDFNDFTDEGLSHLRLLLSLRELFLDGTQINDTGLAHLARLTNLTKLSLRRTAITDTGLAHLPALSNLRNLDLNDTGVTAAAIDKLKKALPELTVFK